MIPRRGRGRPTKAGEKIPRRPRKVYSTHDEN